MMQHTDMECFVAGIRTSPVHLPPVQAAQAAGPERDRDQRPEQGRIQGGNLCTAAGPAACWSQFYVVGEPLRDVLCCIEYRPCKYLPRCAIRLHAVRTTR